MKWEEAVPGRALFLSSLSQDAASLLPQAALLCSLSPRDGGGLCSYLSRFVQILFAFAGLPHLFNRFPLSNSIKVTGLVLLFYP